MTVNALNSGAKVWLADMEDATSPTWTNVIGGQHSLFDAIRGQVDFTSPEGKEYRVGETTPTIVFRPRGWHLTEKHLEFTDRAGQSCAASASLVDAGLYLFHNAQALIDSGRGPYLYLPSWRATWRHASGTRSSGSPRPTWVCATARSARRSSSRPSRPRSRWRRSSTSCATTAPG